jgi:XapX domain-containing protein
MNIRFVIGLLLGFGIGFGCRWLGIPSPAPPVLTGALLVVAMTAGYVLADRYLAPKSAANRRNYGGPTGS